MAQSPSDRAPDKDEWTWDPAYRACLRELLAISAMFIALLAWTIGLCYFSGYGEAAGTPVGVVAGIPRWFLWGVAAPWAVGTVVSIWFALAYMTDHEPPVEEKEATEAGA